MYNAEDGTRNEDTPLETKGICSILCEIWLNILPSERWEVKEQWNEMWSIPQIAHSKEEKQIDYINKGEAQKNSTMLHLRLPGNCAMPYLISQRNLSFLCWVFLFVELAGDC
jgi:hypothetical protein